MLPRSVTQRSFEAQTALKYGALTLGGAINLVPLTGYNAAPFQVRLKAEVMASSVAT